MYQYNPEVHCYINNLDTMKIQSKKQISKSKVQGKSGKKIEYQKRR